MEAAEAAARSQRPLTNAPDSHYLKVGRLTTIFGTLLSIGTAYLARRYNNIMDLLQLVFGFVNAPLFATFLLGMFWKRATGHGACSPPRLPSRANRRRSVSKFNPRGENR